jgi:hypothetical protein
VTVGLLIEVVTLTALVVFFVGHMHWLAADRRHAVWGEGAEVTPIEVVRLAAYGLVVASLVVALGRTAQTVVPRGSGIVGPLSGSAIVSWLQFLATLAGVLMVNGLLFRERYWVWRWSLPLAAGCLTGAIALRLIAELWAAVALGVASGAMPSRRLAARVPRLTIASQLVGLGLALMTVLLVVVVLSQYAVRRPLDGGVLAYGWASVIGVGFAVLLGSCLANLTLYTSARRAALEWKPLPEPAK